MCGNFEAKFENISAWPWTLKGFFTKIACNSVTTSEDV